MKKILSKTILIFFILVSCFTFICCADSSPETPNDSGMKKYVVPITINNYNQFIETTTADYMLESGIISGGHGQTSYHFKGCLTYAYYEVSFTMSYTTINGKRKTETVVCNSAGNGDFIGKDKYNAEIQRVSGVVTYWI